jgi:ribA/ribD-fused uncharacterized protein
MERITDKYVFFGGSELSNWYECKPNFIKYKGITFFNSEQAFMWEKAIYFGDMEIAKQIVKSPSPKIAKELGRSVKNFNAKMWSQVSYDIMIDVNFAKYSQNLILRDILISTEDKIIVEASPTDSLWGIGLHWSDDRCLDEKNWKGENLLGRALMEVRKKLFNEKISKTRNKKNQYR